MQGASNQQACSAGIRWLVIVCLALICVSASAQVMHLHADVFSGTAKHCPICPILHSVTPLTHAVHIDVSFQTAAHLPVCEDSSRPVSAPLFALFSRPPPLV